jgi:hypothetical protein
MKLEFRWELFNMLNHAGFSNPSPAVQDFRARYAASLSVRTQRMGAYSSPGGLRPFGGSTFKILTIQISEPTRIRFEIMRVEDIP